MRRTSAAALTPGIVALALLLAGVDAMAQAPGLLATPGREQPQEVGPPFRLQRAADGRLERVPGLTIENLERLWRQQKGLEAAVAQPPATIESLTLQGSATSGNLGPLQVEVVLRAPADGWQRIALRLAELVWLAQPECKTADVYLDRAESGDTLCWLRRRGSESRHEFRVQAAASATSLGDQRRLRLTMPRCAVSNVEFDLGPAPVEARLASGVGNLSTKPKEDGIEASIQGGDGPLELAWGPPSESNAAAALEATGDVRVELGASTVRWEARITLRAHGGLLSSAQIELPAGARLVPRDNAGYRLTPDAAADGSSVTFTPLLGDRPQQELLVVAEVSTPKADEPIDLAGFNVVGAVRQTGRVTVHGEPQRRPRWGELSLCHPVPPVAGRVDESWIGGFEYDGQPYQLPLTLAVPALRVVVEPRYEIFVEANRLVCIGRWRYRVDGGRVAAIEFDPGEWTIDRWGADESARADLAPASPWALPQPQGGAFEVTWRAVRAATAGESELDLRLPRPLEAELLPAELTVAAADNCAVVPQSSSGGRWTPPEGAAAATSRPWRVEALDAAAQSLKFHRLVHAGELRAESAARVQIRPQAIAIEQSLRFTARYERRSALALRLPAAMLAGGDPEVTLDGVRLPLAIDRSSGQAACDAWALLPEPLLGVIDLRLRASLRGAALSAARLNIPLATPAETTWEGQRLTVDCPTGWQAAPQGSAWRAAQDAGWQTSERVDAVSLDLVPDGRPRAVVDRAWVQTRWANGEQHTRVVYRVVSAHDALAVKLPAPPRGLLAWIDGRPVSATDAGEGRYEIRWPAGPGPLMRVVELAYAIPDSAPWSQALAPKLEAGVTVRRLYWHLPNAGASRLWTLPEGFSDELSWVWTPWGIERRARCDAAALEQWCGARNEREPAAEDGGYLFSATQYHSTLRPGYVSRTGHILGASMLTLAIGMTWLFVPVWRRSLSWGALALVAVGLVVVPSTTLEALQAGLLGVGLVGVAALLERRQSQRPSVAPRSRGSSVSRPESSTRIRSMPPLSSAESSAEPSSESRL